MGGWFPTTSSYRRGIMTNKAIAELVSSGLGSLTCSA